MDDEYSRHLEELRHEYQRRLRPLEKRKAIFGLNTPPETLNEIEDIRIEIARVELEMRRIAPAVDQITMLELRRRARKAYFKKDWLEAVVLLTQLAVQDPEDDDIQAKLIKARRWRRLQEDYRSICELRDEGLWQAVLDALDDLVLQQPDYPDKEGLRTWAERRRGKETIPSFTVSKSSEQLEYAADTGLIPGTLLGEGMRYRIEQRLGSGGFCATYRAYDTQLDRDCAIKHLIIDASWDLETRVEAQQWFYREVQALSTLNDPGHNYIPEIYEFLRETDCLVMKYIKGRNLRQVMQLQGGALPFIVALEYTRAVCSALVYMHTHKPAPVLHRDIKPENIVLGEDGRIWLIDFGLAKVQLPPDAAQSNPSKSAGTPGYTPIEQWRGAAEPRSDIYALAATLYTLVTGTTPLPDRSGVILPARQHNQTITPRIERLIASGMAERVLDRPTAQEFRAELDTLLQNISFPLNIPS